jgi:hypothetical protein
MVVRVPATRVVDPRRKNTEQGVLKLLSKLDTDLLECSARADLVCLHGGTLEVVHLDSLELWHLWVHRYHDCQERGRLVQPSHRPPLVAHLVGLHSCRLQTLPQKVTEASGPVAVRLKGNPRFLRHLHNVVRA